MIVRFVIPLAQSKTGEWPTDEELISQFRSLGLELVRREDPGTTPSTTVSFEKTDGVSIEVEAHSKWFYRKLAAGSFLEAVPSHLVEEIKGFGLYVGVLSTSKTYFYVSRVTVGELTVHIVQADIGTIIRDVDYIVDRLKTLSRSAFQLAKWSEIAPNVEMFTGTISETVSKGSFVLHPIRTFLQGRVYECFALAISIVLALVCFVVDTVPAEPIDLLDPAVRTFVNETWPGAAFSSMLLSIALAVAYIAWPQRRVRWTFHASD